MHSQGHYRVQTNGRRAFSLASSNSWNVTNRNLISQFLSVYMTSSTPAFVFVEHAGLRLIAIKIARVVNNATLRGTMKRTTFCD
jgi:hypothetical protein